MAVLDEVYQERILAHAAVIAREGRLADPDVSASQVSRACGSRVTVDLKLADGVVTDYGQDVEACALGSAAASIVGGAIVGPTVAHGRRTRDALRAMLEEGGPPPDGAVAELAVLEPARVFTNRHGSILLALDASVKAIAKQAGAKPAG